MNIYEFCDKHELTLLIGYNPKCQPSWSACFGNRHIIIYGDVDGIDRLITLNGAGNDMEKAIKDLVRLIKKPSTDLFMRRDYHKDKVIDTSELEV